ncbi:hypothetical protein AB0E08_08405 [Streptomyces sp. NPDC048281]|uniref:hypothetical protein n=1 Tax=Streptomyces sp. NPDC048281 TaxID=3154715 RepID=UPI00343BBE63
MGTDPRHMRITATRDDVLTGMAKRTPNLATITDIALAVVAGVHKREKVWDGKTAMLHIKQADLKRLVADLVAEGALILRTGPEWAQRGAPTWNIRKGGHYYALPEEARKWEAEAARQQDAALQEAAEEHARGVLAERYPEDFASLVHAYRAEHGG